MSHDAPDRPARRRPRRSRLARQRAALLARRRARLWLVEEGTVEVFAVPRGRRPARGPTCAPPGRAGALRPAPPRPTGTATACSACSRWATRARGCCGWRAAARASWPGRRLRGRRSPRGSTAGARPRRPSSPRAAAPKVFDELRPGRRDPPGRGRPGRPRRAEGVVWVRHLEGTLALSWARPELRRAAAACAARSPRRPGWSAPARPGIAALGDRATCCGDGRSSGTGSTRFHALCLACVALQARAGRAAGARARSARKADLRPRRPGAAPTPASPRCSPPAAARGRRWPERDGRPAARRLPPGRARRRGSRSGACPNRRRGARQGDLLAAICARLARPPPAGDPARRLVAPRQRAAGRPSGSSTRSRRSAGRWPCCPPRPRSYELVDPVERTRAPVDAGRRREPAPARRYMFYPPLPERPLEPARPPALAPCAAAGATCDDRAHGDRRRPARPAGADPHRRRSSATSSPARTAPQLVQITLALIVSALAAAAFQVTRSIAVLRLGGKIDGAVQAAVWDRLLSLPASFFRRYTVGDLANRSLGIDTIRDLLTGNVLTSVLAAVFSLFSFALLFYYSSRLALRGDRPGRVAPGGDDRAASGSSSATSAQLLAARRARSRACSSGSSAASPSCGWPAPRRAPSPAGPSASPSSGERAIAAQRGRERPGGSSTPSTACSPRSRSSPWWASPREETLLDRRVPGLQRRLRPVPGRGAGDGRRLLQRADHGAALRARSSRSSRTLPGGRRVARPSPASWPATIEFSHVSFRYQRGRAADPATTSRSGRGPGEFVALVGPSGAGQVDAACACSSASRSRSRARSTSTARTWPRSTCRRCAGRSAWSCRAAG